MPTSDDTAYSLVTAQGILKMAKAHITFERHAPKTCFPDRAIRWIHDQQSLPKQSNVALMTE